MEGSHTQMSISSSSMQSTASMQSTTVSGPSRASESPNPLPQSCIESQLPLKRKESTKKSVLWDYFTRCKLDNSDEIDPDLCTCNTCGEIVKCATKRNGTSSMWAHVNNKCLKHPLHKQADGDSKQSKLCVDNVTGARTYHKYNKKRCDDKCIEMIIKDELPFRFVEKEGFREFVKELCPEWPIMNRRQIAKGILDRFNYEKTLLLTGLKSSETRVSITTDTWTSVQNINYMVLTAHFLDSDWHLHKRILNFCPITSHKGEDIGKAVELCLRQWEITKVFTITVDNAASNDVAVSYIKRRLRGYKTLTFDGEYMHLRCACHVINLIVKDGLKELESAIEAIWNCAKYVRSSPSRLDKFREFAVLENLHGKANVPLDVVTRWNSTYLMLEAALKFEGVFGRMADEDASFTAYFQGKVGPPEHGDWRKAEAFCTFLKNFYDATLKLSAWKSVTANILLIEMITLQTEIDKACDSSDVTLRNVGGVMKEKFNKYWGSFEIVNKVVMIAHVLDPRYKLQWAKLAMRKVKASPQVIASIETDLKNILMIMYEEYKGEQGTTWVDDTSDYALGNDDLDGLDDISREIATQRVADQANCIKNEVDQYLSDKYVSMFTKGFDIAKWWKGNETAYPVLSKLAKDILAIPCSTVSSENAFSLGSRIIDPFRSSLTPKTVEALVCTSDWLRSEPLNLYKDPSEDDLALFTELEEIEREAGGVEAS